MPDLDDLTCPAGDDDVVGGVPARLVAAPATTAEASALIRAAAGLTVVVRGHGTKIDWGTPPRELDLIIDTHRLAGVREHAAGDLITVLGAGTPLDDLDLPGQQLALDSPLPGATIGGTVATNVSGPRRLLYGTARDLLIGIEVIRADGTVTRSGGKVVKNVAGYDLGKLYTGSYGTLGLITECAFRLHPRPAAAAYISATASSPAAAGRLVAAVLDAQVAASAIELNAPPDGDLELVVLLEGTPAGVRDRAGALAKLLPGAEVPRPAWWGTYPFTSRDLGLKLTAALSQIPALLSAARSLPLPLLIRGSAATGVLYARLGGASMCAEQSEPETFASRRDSQRADQGEPIGRPAGGASDTRLGGDYRCAEQRGEGGAHTVGRPGDAATGADGRAAARTGGQLGDAATGADGGEVARAVERLREAALRAGGHVVVLTAPEGVRDGLDMWGPVGGLGLMRRVKEQFDPEGLFAPGRFVGGI